jgi:hypothetical protein
MILLSFYVTQCDGGGELYCIANQHDTLLNWGATDIVPNIAANLLDPRMPGSRMPPYGSMCFDATVRELT